jgi:hypothetical protein
VTDEPYTNANEHSFVSAVRDHFTRAIDTIRAGLKAASQEIVTWDFFRWAVIGLLAANFLLVVLLFGAIKSEMAGAAQNHDNYAQDISSMRAALDKQITEAKAGFDQSIADLRTNFEAEVVRINAKLDKPVQAPPPATPVQPPKPPVKPRRR